MQGKGKEEWDLKKAIGSKMKPYEVNVTKMELALYALGLGF